MGNNYHSIYLRTESMLAIALDRAGLWGGEGWYVQVNMHGPGGGTDCYLGPFETKAAADAAGKSEIERQEKQQHMEEFIKKHGLTEDQFFGR